MPLYTPDDLYGPAAPGTSAATLYTMPAATAGIVKEILVANTTGSAATLTLSIVRSGGTAGVANRIMAAVSFPANSITTVEVSQVLNPGDFISGLQGVASALVVTISGVTYPTSGAGPSSSIVVQDEGSNVLTAATTFNFTGAGVTATGSGGVATVNIPGGGGGGSTLTVQDEGSSLATAAETLNFTGAGVTASGTGVTKTINIPGGGGGGTQRNSLLYYQHAIAADERYLIAGEVTASVITTITPPLEEPKFFPIASARGGTIDRLALWVMTAATAGGVAMLGLYDSISDSNLTPNALIASGEVDTTVTGIRTVTVNVTLDPTKLYWLMILPGVATSTVRATPAAGMYPIFGIGLAGSTTPAVGWYRGSNVAYTTTLPNPWTLPLQVYGTAPFPALAVRYSA